MVTHIAAGMIPLGTRQIAMRIGRRQFISALGGTVFAWPFAARAQASHRLGLLFATSAQAAKARGLLEEVTQGLKEHGWVEGQNITFEYRFADGKDEVLPKLAAELVQLRLDAILTDSTPATQAAKNATRTIPIVMAVSNDPVASGFVASLNRPGGNITGTSLLAPELAGKRLQLLTEIVPGLARVAVLSNPSNPSHALLLKQTQTAAQSLSVELRVVEAAAPDKLDGAFAAITKARANALIVLADAMFFGQTPSLVAFTATARLPALFPEKQVAQAGGLMAYGLSIPASFRRAGAFVDKILRGADPADLPVEVPTTFEFVINLKTAKALGLTVPDKLLATADEVIE
jgi:putative tryptophan/tyrosine transport system substrate-binding protein